MAEVLSKVSSPSQESYFIISFTFLPGTEYEDTVTIAPGVTISGQSIGVAHKSSKIYPSDGILG